MPNCPPRPGRERFCNKMGRLTEVQCGLWRGSLSFLSRTQVHYPFHSKPFLIHKYIHAFIHTYMHTVFDAYILHLSENVMPNNHFYPMQKYSAELSNLYSNSAKHNSWNSKLLLLNLCSSPKTGFMAREKHAIVPDLCIEVKLHWWCLMLSYHHQTTVFCFF